MFPSKWRETHSCETSTQFYLFCPSKVGLNYVIVKFAKSKLDDIHSSFLPIFPLGGGVLNMPIPYVFLCASFFLVKPAPPRLTANQ